MPIQHNHNDALTPSHPHTPPGEVLRGDRIVNTPYQLSVLQDEGCRVLCSPSLTAEQSDLFIQRIRQEYTVHM